MSRLRWDSGVTFRQVVLEPEWEDRPCADCGKFTHIYEHRDRRLHLLAGVMERFAPGLFVWCHGALPPDNLDLERWFRLPKGHERRIHGRAHAGVRIVQEGPTLLPTLDAHMRHPAPFLAADLIPTLGAVPPLCQSDAERRRTIMRRARSRKRRPILLAELEHRYQRVLGS